MKTMPLDSWTQTGALISLTCDIHRFLISYHVCQLTYSIVHHLTLFASQFSLFTAGLPLQSHLNSLPIPHCDILNAEEGSRIYLVFDKKWLKTKVSRNRNQFIPCLEIWLFLPLIWLMLLSYFLQTLHGRFNLLFFNAVKWLQAYEWCG